MAWSESSRLKTVFGNKKVVIIKGTVASGDTSSGAIDTGLVAIDYVSAHFKDLGDKTIQTSESGGALTLTFTNPAATKIVEIMVFGH